MSRQNLVALVEFSKALEEHRLGLDDVFGTAAFSAELDGSAGVVLSWDGVHGRDESGNRRSCIA